MGQVLSCVKKTMTLLVCGSTPKALPANRSSRSTSGGYRRLTTAAQTFVPGDISAPFHYAVVYASSHHVKEGFHCWFERLCFAVEPYSVPTSRATARLASVINARDLAEACRAISPGGCPQGSALFLKG